MNYVSKPRRRNSEITKGSALTKYCFEASSRSNGKFYQGNFNNQNMWIEIKRILPKYKLKSLTFVN
jgi:hypothetical protein